MPAPLILYFAYGSNLSQARLRARAASARRIGTYYLPEHDLRFHKRGTDGSGKCDAYYTGSEADRVYGSLFTLTLADKSALDAVEGLGAGYNEKTVTIHADSAQSEQAVTYVATDIRENLQPYSWYWHHVSVGAHEAALPDGYIARKILSVNSVQDSNNTRHDRESARHA